MGGTVANIDTVACAPIESGTGALGSWSSTTVLPAAQWFNRAAVVGTTIVHGSGHETTDWRSHYTTTNTGGTLNAWVDGGLFDSNAGARWDYGMTSATASGDWVVIIGGNTGSGVVDTVEVTKVTGGVPGACSTNTNTYPPGAQRHMSAVGVDDLIISLGGTTAGNTSSATTDTAISSGVSAAISIPMGALSRPHLSGAAMPLASSRL